MKKKIVALSGPKIPLDPMEWDFRSITDSQIEFAIHYEYARESPWAIEAIQTYWSKKIDGSTSIKEQILLAKKENRFFDYRYDRWPGTEIKDNLLIGIATKLLSFPEPLLSIVNSDPKGLVGAMRAFKMQHPSDYLMMDYSDFCDSGASQHWLTSTLKPHESLKWIKLNWTYSDEELVKKFQKLLKSRPKEHPARTGKAAQLPFEKLKWLAAYRLDKASYTYAQAQEILQLRKKDVGNTNAILPTYSSQGGWIGAIKEAKIYLRSLVPDDFGKAAPTSPKS